MSTGSTSAPLTKEVTTSLEYLRQAISEVHALDDDLAETMTAIVDDLCVNLENQLLLMFANFGTKAKEREDLLLQSQQHEDVVSYYKEVQEKLNVAAQKRNFSPRDHSRRREESSISSASFLTGLNTTTNNNTAGNPGANAFLTEGTASIERSPEHDSFRALSVAMYSLLETCAYNVQAERASIYLFHKGSGSLRIICSVPDQGPSNRAAFIASHQGIPGATFSTGVAISLNEIDADTQKNYVRPTDQQLGLNTNNCLTFPIQDSTNRIIGVLETANRIHQSKWSPADESLMYFTCQVLGYLLTNFEGVDFHTMGAPFNPTQSLHVLKPYRPKPLPQELQEMPNARDQKNPQLVARVNQQGDEVPLAVKGKQQSAIENSEEVKTVLQVKEIQSYLKSIDISYRHTMTELVAAKEREIAAKEDTAKRLHRIRVLEGNISYLHEQLAQFTGTGSYNKYGRAGQDGDQDDDETPHRTKHSTTSSSNVASVKELQAMTATLGQQLNLSGVGGESGLLDASSNSALALLGSSGGGMHHSTGKLLNNSRALVPLKGADQHRSSNRKQIAAGGGRSPSPTNVSLQEKKLLLEDAQAQLATLKAIALQSSSAKQRGMALSPIRARGEARSASALHNTSALSTNLSTFKVPNNKGSIPRQPATSIALDELKKRKARTPGPR